MHLKTLTLRGFKSFASATTLNFEPGITCVVGPNGSGKSNVVDALTWVMGEQGAKALRGGSMTDIIFAGTSSKSGLGRAEVTLTIDNSDGVLPIDYAEVKISRTLFRGGGSEYAINDTPCRLLDIQELLSDTGMGRQMHVIVGQGQLDSILNSTPEQRRGFIEEAAGVLKHRRRKERAERKLAAMADKLARLEDLTGEVRRQLGPLARQADLARKATQIQALIYDLNARLLAADADALTQRLAAHDADAAVLTKRIEECGAKTQELKAQVQELGQRQVALNPELDQATTTWNRLTALVERLRATRSILTERTHALAQAHSYTPAVSLTQLRTDAEAATGADRAAMADVEAAEGALAAANEALDVAETTANTHRERLEAAQREVANYAQIQGSAQSGLEGARIKLEAASANVASGEEELARAAQRLEQARAELAAGPDLGPQDDLSGQLQQARAARDEAKQELDAVRDLHSGAQREHSHWVARHEALTMSIRSQATSATPSQTADGTAGLDLDPFISALEIEPGWEDAVGAALGSYRDAVVITAQEQLQEVHALAGQSYMRLVIAGSDTAGPDSSGNGPEGQGEAAPVRASAALTPVLNELLAKTRFVADLAAAQAVVATDPQLRAVTRDGIVVGAHRGAWEGEKQSIVHLHAAQREAAAQVAASRAGVADAAGEIDRAVAALASSEEAYEELLAQVRQADAQRAEIAAAVGRLQSAVVAADAQLKRQENATAQARASHAQAEERLAAAQARMGEVEAQRPEVDVATLSGAAEASGKAVVAARGAQTEALLALRAAQERARAAQARARALRQNLAREEQLIAAQAHAEAQRKTNLARVEALARLTDRALASCLDSLSRAEVVRQDLAQAVAQADGQVRDLGAKYDAALEELHELTDASHRDEVARAELTLRLEQVDEQAAQLGLERGQLLSQYGPDQLVTLPDEPDQAVAFNRTKVEKHFKQAQRQLTQLGKINPLALEEHQAAQQRFDYLANQLSDLKQTRADLVRLIKDVDAAVQTAFEEAFADTAAAFNAVFPTLFPGGSGRLVLSDGDDLLATGIEIEARPAGKKVKRLSLLSGGERSLAALAFLVAIFKARPSPFYVMDEVEAALDDTNLGRMLEIFTDLQRDSQLIIITHQKRTMEVADALYGVTMRDGVSAVVSQRLG